MSNETNNTPNISKPKALLEVLKVSTKLGLTSFGGPIAHLAYFHNEYIRKRKWMDERSYADLVALCQFLPGPASSQIGIGIGTMRAGLLGGVMAWIGFTMPSVIAMVLFAFLLKGFNIGNSGLIYGLKIVAVAIVAHAVLSMGQKLASDRIKATIALISAAIVLLWQTAFSLVAVIILSGLLGLFMYRKTPLPEHTVAPIKINKIFSVFCIIAFFSLLFILPLLRELISSQSIALFDSFYRSGSLVFGGGHVVLPLLERELVPVGWVSEQDFLTGYGATQAVPGPLFTFSAYLGAIAHGIPGAIAATIGVFLPSFLLVIGVLPFWNILRQNTKIQGALVGINAAVVGLLLAALYNPLWTTAIRSSKDFVLAAALFIMLIFWKLPPWVIVITGALGGILVNLKF
ncbi:MAG: chromate ion transporter family protein [Clostridia bacterium]|jgi:chromate transporter|nr:chromate ion transporter family protein [Clostridia bacterium]